MLRYIPGLSGRIKIIFLVLIFSIALFQLCLAQHQQKIDSLLQVLSTAKEDTTKVNTLIALGTALSYSNPDTSIILANQALSLSEKAKSKKHIADSYHAIGLANYGKGNYPEALKYYFEALKIYETLRDKKGIQFTLVNTGNVYRNQGDFQKALDYYFRALKINEELGNKKGIAYTLGNIGNVYTQQGDYPESLDYYFRSLKMNEELDDKLGVAKNLGNIGNVYAQQGDYSKALDYYFRSLKMNEERGDKNVIENNLGNIGLVYWYQGDYPKALDYFLKVLKMAEQLGDEHGIALALGNIANVYSDLGDNSKALDYYFKVLKMAEQSEDKNEIAIQSGNIGSVYTETGKFIEAEEYLKKAIAINDSIGALDYLRQSEELLSKLYDTTGRYQLALEHYKKAMVIKDTLYNQEKNEEITRKEMNYEFEKKQSTEKAVHEKQLAVAEVEIKKQKVLKYSLIGGLVLTLLLFFFGYRFYRARQVLHLQSIRNRIADDLHDDIGSTLNSISVYSEVAKQKLPAVVQELEQIGEASRKIIDNIGDIVWTINAKNDSFEQIILRLRSHTYNLLRAKNIEHAFRADESLNEMKLSMETRKNFYLIFKEALNNLVKYSNASHVSISLTNENYFITLTIRDNGVGYDVKQTFTGNGLLSMRTRAEEMKAGLKIDSVLGGGTNVELKLRV